MSDAERGGSAWQRHPRALWRRSFDRVLILPDGRDDLLLLEGVGAAIWQLLERPATTEDLVEPLAAHYGQDPDVVGHELGAFLAELAATGAVHRT